MPKRPRKNKPEAEVVLICNPRAGGRWKELAGILDSQEAEAARRIVTDSVEDIATALADLGREAKLICIYGGDGTIQRILDRLEPGLEQEVHLALLGGGTMNVTSRWCGFSNSPTKNFRHVMQGYRSGNLLLRETPMLEVSSGPEFHRGFTFGMGPVVRVLDAYERGTKGKLAACKMGLKAVSAVWTQWPPAIGKLVGEMNAAVALDGEISPYQNYSALFANVTGQINRGIEPFASEPERDRFFYAAYAVSAKEMTMALPFLMRGWLPIDPSAIFSKLPKLETDSRYVNGTGASLHVRTAEPIYTVDGEILRVHGNEVSVGLGPMLKLAVGPDRRGADVA